jgi:acetylornithine deacetylase
MAVIAIDLGPTECRAALASLAGRVVAEDRRRCDDRGPVQLLLASLRRLRDVAAAEQLAVEAVTVAVPQAGVIGRDLDGVLAEHVSELLLVEDDHRLAALAEARRDHLAADQVLVRLSIGQEVDGAVVAGGRLLGARGDAMGGLGSILTHVTGLHAAAGAPVDLGSLVSAPAIARRAGELLARNGTPSRMTAGADAAAVLAAAAAGDEVGRRVLAETLDHLAVALVAIAAVASPSQVVLDGSVGRALEPHLDALRARLAARLPALPALRVSLMDGGATLAGGIAAGVELARSRTTARGVWLASSPVAEAGRATLPAPRLAPALRERILEAVDADHALELVRALVRAPSEGDDEHFLTGILAGELNALGFRDVAVDEVERSRANARGLRRGEGGGQSLLLLGHLDTLATGGWAERWRGDPRADAGSCALIDGQLWGSGAAGSKGGMATALAALWVLHRAGLRPRGDVAFAAVCDREAAGPGLGLSRGMKALRAPLGDGRLGRPDFALYLEPTGLAVCTAQPGVLPAEIRVHKPERGDDSALRAVLGALGEHGAAIAGGSRHPLLGSPSLGIAAVFDEGECWRVDAVRTLLPGERLDAAAAALEAAVTFTAREREVSVSFGYRSGRDHPLGGRPFELSPTSPHVARLRAAIQSVRPDRGGVVAAQAWSELSFVDELGIPGAYFSAGDPALCRTLEERVAVQDLLDGVRAMALFVAEHCGVEPAA